MLANRKPCKANVYSNAPDMSGDTSVGVALCSPDGQTSAHGTTELTRARYINKYLAHLVNIGVPDLRSTASARMLLLVADIVCIVACCSNHKHQGCCYPKGTIPAHEHS